MRSIDEAILHCKEVAENKEQAVYDLIAFGYSTKEERDACIECANDHRQLAEWLKELKELKDKNTPKELVKDYDGGYKSGWLRCPSCFYILGGFNEKLGVVAINHNANNCLSCGQAIKHHE